MSREQEIEQLFEAEYQRRYDALMKNVDLFLQEREAIIKNYRGAYEASVELCGEDSEEAAEDREQLKNILGKPIEDSREDIIGFFNFFSECVNDEPETYLKGDPELFRMLRLFSPRYQALAYLKQEGSRL